MSDGMFELAMRGEPICDADGCNRRESCGPACRDKHSFTIKQKGYATGGLVSSSKLREGEVPVLLSGETFIPADITRDLMAEFNAREECLEEINRTAHRDFQNRIIYVPSMIVDAFGKGVTWARAQMKAMQHDTTASNVVVDRGYHWQPMSSCPINSKVQLLGKGGLPQYGYWDGKNPFWVGWAPIPTRNPNGE